MTFDLHKLIGEDWRAHHHIPFGPNLFHEEVERIWQKSWLYVAHESEIPHPGDFLTLTLARQPLLVVRSGDNQVCVLFNICRHRAVTVCRKDKGNTSHFICTDHGWVYNTNGGLIGLSGPNCSVRKFAERRGLTSVPRLDMYRGFIFASLSPEGESLDKHLGEAKTFIDLVVDQSKEGLTVAVGRRIYHGNGVWKLQRQKNIDHDQVKHLGNGHALLQFPPPSQESELSRKRKGIERQLGQKKMQGIRGEGQTLFLFPNLFLVDHSCSSLCILNPVTSKLTEIIVMPFIQKNESKEKTSRRLQQYEVFTQLAEGSTQGNTTVKTRAGKPLGAGADSPTHGCIT